MNFNNAFAIFIQNRNMISAQFVSSIFFVIVMSAVSILFFLCFLLINNNMNVVERKAFSLHLSDQMTHRAA